MDITPLLSFLAQIHIDNLPQVNASQDTLRNILGISFAVIGGMAGLFLLIGAARYGMAAGDSGQLKQARDTILYAIIGIVVSMSAFFVVQFVLGSVN